MKKHLPKIILFLLALAVCGLIILILGRKQEPVVETLVVTDGVEVTAPEDPESLAPVPHQEVVPPSPDAQTSEETVDTPPLPGMEAAPPAKPVKPFSWHPKTKFYTVQLGSFRVRDNVDKEFARFADILQDDDRKFLRIEKVGEFYTIRTGMFTSISLADILWRKILNDSPEVRLLHAHVREERIVTMNNGDDFQVEVEAPSVEKPTVAEQKTKVIPVPPPSDAEVKTLEGKQFYTIQLASMADAGKADKEMNRLVGLLPEDALDYLRLEKVGKFFTVRTGRFLSKAEAEAARSLLMSSIPGVPVILSDDKPQRVFTVYGAPRVVGAPKKEETPPVTSPVIESIAPPPQIIEEEEISTTMEVVEEAEEPAEPVVIVDEAEKKIAQDVVEKVAEEVVEEVVTEPEDEDTVQDEVTKEKEAEKEEEPEEFGMIAEVISIIKKDDQGNQLGRPSTLFFDKKNSELYVLNGRSNRLITFGPDYFPSSSAGKGRGLSYIRGGLGVDDGIYVCHGDETGMFPRLSKMNAAFLPLWVKKLEGIEGAGNFLPYRLAMGKDRLYVIGLNSSKTMVMDRQGNFLHWLRIDPEAVGSKMKVDPDDPEPGVLVSDLTIDSLGNILFLSEGDGRVYVYNSQEEYLFKFGKKGGSRGKLSRGRGLAVDEQKKCIYVVDYLRHTVIVYDFAGTQRFEFGGRGWGEGWFNFPTDIEVGFDGHVIVCDFFNDRVQVFRTSTKEEMPDRPEELWKSNQGANG